MISFFIVRWKGGDEVKRCLASIVDERRLTPAEIILVDSGSGDGGAKALASQFPNVSVIELTENRSFAWAANQGVEASIGELIYLLNPDTEVESVSTDILVNFLDAHPRRAGAVPLLLDPSLISQHRWQLRHLPRPSQLALGLRGKTLSGNRIPATSIPVEQPAAAAWLLRRNVWTELGGLDPIFEPAWWEDVDFCRRLKSNLGNPAEQGFWLVPEARVTHLGGSSLHHLGAVKFQVAYAQNLMRYVRRHHGPASEIIRLTFATSLRLRALLRPQRRKAYMAAARALDER